MYEGRGKDEALLVLTAEQAVPVTADMLWFNRVVVRARRKFHAMGATLEVAAKGGNIIGDLPPYEAFQIGGANSVRGYPEGGVGTGRKFIVGSAELSVPLAPDQFDGYVFFDIGSDLKSGSQVLGIRRRRGASPDKGTGTARGSRCTRRWVPSGSSTPSAKREPVECTAGSRGHSDETRHAGTASVSRLFVNGHCVDAIKILVQLMIWFSRALLARKNCFSPVPSTFCRCGSPGRRRF